MNGSELRKCVHATISPDIRGRIDFHVTRYRDSHDSDYGRAWITVDGEQVASWSCFEHLIRTNEWTWLFETPRRPLTSAEDYLRVGAYSKKDFTNILREYLNTNPRKLLQSSVPLARALAVADRRIGKRTLELFPIDVETDLLVKLFFALRVQPTRSS